MRGRVVGTATVLAAIASGIVGALFTVALCWLLIHGLELVGYPFLADHVTDAMALFVMALGFIGGVIESRRGK